MGLHGAADSKIIDGEDIGPVQLEHEVHLDGPPVEPLDPGPVRYYLLTVLPFTDSKEEGVSKQCSARLRR